MDQEFTTPMMKQYEEIKAKYQDCIVFYRLGDFYETFLEDAHIASRVLDITLTTRSRGKDGRTPMAGPIPRRRFIYRKTYQSRI